MTSNDSIATDIQNGDADFGLLGSDKYGELEDPTLLRFESVAKLACQFVFAVPTGYTINTSYCLRTATFYPKALQRFLASTSLNACLGPVRPGKVEGTIKQGIADAIFDIREKGSTLAANQLSVFATGPSLELGGVWQPNLETT